MCRVRRLGLNPLLNERELLLIDFSKQCNFKNLKLTIRSLYFKLRGRVNTSNGLTELLVH